MSRARPDAHVRVARRNLCVIVILDIINQIVVHVFNVKLQNIVLGMGKHIGAPWVKVTNISCTDGDCLVPHRRVVRLQRSVI